MNTKFKISYSNAIKFILLLMLFSIISHLIYQSFLYFTNIKIDGYILLPTMYIIPFIFFFIFIYNKYPHLFNINEININEYRLSKIKLYSLIIIVTLCSMIISNYISSVICYDEFIIDKSYKDLEKLLEKQLNHPIPLILTTSLLSPLCEEFFFRGIILKGLLNNEKIHPIKAIIFSSFLFGLMHMNMVQFIGGILMGSVFGLIYFYTHSIFNCILSHSLNNTIAIIFFLRKKNIEIFNHIDKITTSNIIIFILCCFIIIISYYIFIKKFKKK